MLVLEPKHVTIDTWERSQLQSIQCHSVSLMFTELGPCTEADMERVGPGLLKD